MIPAHMALPGINYNALIVVAYAIGLACIIVATWLAAGYLALARRERAEKVGAARCTHPTTRGRIHYAACPHCDWVGELHHFPDQAMAELDAHQAEEIARAT